MTRAHAQQTTSRPPAAALSSTQKSTMTVVIAALAAISGIVNLLGLTAPLFMLQVYDRVLASRSLSTLAGLSFLAVVLYAFQALFDVVRSRVLLRIGEWFDRGFSRRVHDAVTRLPLDKPLPGDGLQPLRDLDNVRAFLSSPGPTAFFDLPWMPVYLAICFIFHVWIGVTALVGAIVLVSLTLLTNALSRAPARAMVQQVTLRNAQIDAGRRNAEVVRAMGLGDRLYGRWKATNADYLAANRRTGDVASTFGGISRGLRAVLQSALLAVGAWLVIRQEVSPGVMVASSIMMGRALAPVDLAISTWKPFLMAQQSWARLSEMLGSMSETPAVLALPAPQAELRVEALAIAPPGDRRATVNGVSFVVCAGSALGVIGHSGCGKSTLARALVGAWRPASGNIRLDGARFDQWDRTALGRHIGYLPQGTELFDGTIAENIARFDEDADSAAIVAAAQAAGVHDMIVRFEHGYQTRINEAGSALSAGQRQRIGLARALYGDPFLVVLDEPNANLDAEGEAAVVAAIAAVRARRGIVVAIAHRPSAMGAVDLVLAMQGGRVKAFGPRDEVLSQITKPATAAKPVTAGFAATARSVAPLRMVAPPTAAASPIRTENSDASS